MSTTNNTKDTIYIDVDDEITGIIEKLTASPKRIVALVLPKRAAVLQSVVNMKLLKRRADDAKKQLVLITSEAGLLPLAGSVGLHVAKSLQSKPEIPSAPELGDPSDQVIAASLPDEPEAAGAAGALEDAAPKLDPKKPIGVLAGLRGSSEPKEESIELDNDDEPVEAGAAAVAKTPKDKKLKVPNFEKFRTRLMLGGLGIILLVSLFVYALIIAPKAKITIKTDSSTVNTSLPVTLDTAQANLDTSKSIIPAKSKTYKKTDTQKVPATGEQNKGAKASGSVTITAKKCSGNPFVVPDSVPAGTGVSSGGQTYITQSTANFSGTGTDSAGCYTYSSGSGINIVAQGPGGKYNTTNATFTVAGRSDAAASGSTSGGTDNIVKVVNGADIETAKQKFTAQNDTAATEELKKQFSTDSLTPIVETLVTGTANVTTTPNIGDEATEVTVTSEVTYTMLGVKKADLQKVVDADMKKQIDQNKQTLLDDGLDKASYRSNEKNDKNAKVTINSVGIAGAQLDTDKIRNEAAGKKKGAVIASLKEQPGVKDVTITYSPFWVLSVPKKASHITVVIEQPDQSPQTSKDNASTN